MIDYTLYELQGKILAVGKCPLENLSQQEAVNTGLGVLQGGSRPPLDYVDVAATPPAIKSKQSMALTLDKATITADGIDQAKVSNIPAGAEVTWPDGVVETIIMGQIIFSVDLAGSYEFSFTKLEYLNEVLSVTAIP